MVIDRFRGDYDFLSNFYWAEVAFAGVRYPTLEHAFQASKTEDPVAREHIRQASSPGVAKMRGRRVVLRPDWDNVRLAMMRVLVYDKFTRHMALRDRLIATGDAILVEGNTWSDRFWGVCDGEGENHLGRILMDTRQKLR